MKSFESLIGPAARAAMRDDRRIKAVISRIVPADILEHVTFCRLADRQLRVTLDGAAWVSKLRFSERALLSALAHEGLDARTVSWHVAPVPNPTRRESAERSAGGRSDRAARTVRSAAESASASGDDELARQLRRMAAHLTGGRSRAGPRERSAPPDGGDRRSEDDPSDA